MMNYKCVIGIILSLKIASMGTYGLDSSWHFRRAPPGNTLPEPTLSDDQNILLKRIQKGVPADVGPVKTQEYNPNPGYEPYWEGGAWVFATTATEKKVHYLCGVHCSDPYRSWGKLCGISRAGEFKTFDNFCVMANSDCNGKQGWLTAYRGACQTDQQLRKYRQKEILGDTDRVLDNYFKLYKKQAGG